MRFETSLKYLSDGKKIRRACWNPGSYWTNSSKGIVNSLGEHPHINIKQLQSDDWEVLDSEKDKQIEKINEFIRILESLRTATEKEND